MMERGIDHPRRNTVGDRGAQGRLARAAGKADIIAVPHAPVFGVMRVDFQHILVVPDHVFGAPGLRTHIVLRQDAPGGQQQRKARSGLFIGGHVFRADELALAAHEAVHMHDRRAFGRGVVAGPLDRAAFIQHVIAHIGKSRCQHGDFIHDLAGMGVVPVGAHGIGQHLGDLPVGIAVLRRHHLAHAVDAALGVGERAVLFQKGRTGQEHMRIVGGLIQEQVMHDDAVHRRQPGRDMPGVWVRLQDVLALAIQAPERAFDGGVQHVGNAQAGFMVDLDAPGAFEQVAHIVVLDMAIAGQLMREAAHVAAALHVVLAAQRVHTHARAADIAGQHGQVGDADHGG